ncbi:MAG: ABC transporter ATP-binding protein [Hyphomicrobiales bacterium]|nr:ABC transporter ATP-binding protein [Hyphomicrobiales bacterium]
MSEPILIIDDVSKSFRGLLAVAAVSFEVRAGSITALIGPNGAGKTTLFNVIAGVFAPDRGRVVFAGDDVTGRRPDRICHAGIGRTFQIVRPFPGLSVAENVTIGALRKDASVPAAEHRAGEILDLLGLSAKAREPAANLTLPERKRLEVARALATGPKILLLDEVMAGLRPGETDEMVAVFRKLNAETGITIFLIEHVMRAVMALSEEVVVLNHGRLISRGTPEEVVRDPAVLECYLGEDEVA